MKAYEKVLAILLSLLIMISAASVCSWGVFAEATDITPDAVATADEVTDEKSTSDENNLIFEYEVKDGEVIITGMEGTADELVVPDFIEGKPVVKIDRMAFYSSIYLLELTLPHTLREIGEYAFMYCDYLKTVSLSEGLEVIGESAFDGCYSLEKICIPSTVTVIGSSAFENCESLVKINIPESVKTLSESAFAGCSSLDEVVIPHGINIISKGVFAGCYSLREIKIPEGVTSVESVAFLDCWSLEKVALPESLAKIGERAFSNCDSLKDFTVSQNVSEIQSSAFSSCDSLVTVKLPQKLAVLGKGVFSDCVKLENINLPQGITQLEAKLFDGCTSLKSVTVSEGITRIVKEAFIDCTSLETLYLPESLTKIDVRAFYRCTALKDVYYAGSEYAWGNVSIGANQPLFNATIHFAKDNPEMTEPATTPQHPEYETEDGFKYIAENGEAVITGYTGTSDEITIPAHAGEYSVTAIGERAFEGMDFLKIVKISEGIKTVRPYAFCLCTGIERFEIPRSLKTFEIYAVYGCESLSFVRYEGSRSEWKEIDLTLGNDAIKNLTHYDINFAGQPPITYPTHPTLPPEPETNRFYIYMPTSWEDSENFEGIGVYWNKGSDIPETERGVEAARTYTENVYCIDLPTDVEEIVFNNFYSGAWNQPSRTHFIKTTGYDQGESDTYPWGIDSLVGMIYVIHGEGEKLDLADDRCEYVYKGEWYYYYGNGEYGITPEKSEEFYTASSLAEPVTPFFESGDVNRDENLNIKDATLIQKFLAKISDLSPAQQKLADYNDDKKVNVRDATAIQKKIAHIG